MTDLRQAVAAAALVFAPGRPPHSWPCALHPGGCPTDVPRWRALHQELTGILADLEAPGPAEDFETWLDRATAGCRPADRQTSTDPAAVRQATQQAADRSRAWLVEHEEVDARA